MSMSFSGKDRQILGTSTWQSDHYMAFTRLSLFHFAPLEGRNLPKNMMKVIKAFKRVFVLWFCLVSSAYGDEKVSSAKIDNYVKLFLSSCRSFCVLAENDMTKKKDKSKKKNTPFYISGANYLSLLNIRKMQDVSGELREAHEAFNEAFIKYVKKELPTMRHRDEFLVTVQRKQLTTSVFSWLNRDNPKSCQDQYERNYNLKFYRRQNQQDPLHLLEDNDVLT